MVVRKKQRLKNNEDNMKSKAQNLQLEKKNLLKTHRDVTKKSTMKALSLKPTRSLKRASGLRPNPLKLK